MLWVRYSGAVWLLLILIGCTIQQVPADFTFNTTCESISISLNTDSAVYLLKFAGGNTIRVELSTFIERYHLTLYHSTEYSRNVLSFHQIAVGSRVTHELGIEVNRKGNITWDIQFIRNTPNLSGFYQIDIGGCRTVDNITILTPIIQKTGNQFNLTIPDISLQSLTLFCPFDLSFFNLQIFYNTSQVRAVNVFSDSPRDILAFSPIQLDSRITAPGPYEYLCYGTQEGLDFKDVSLLLTINSSQTYARTRSSVREGDRISFDLDAICQPFYSQFIYFSSNENTNEPLSIARMSFTLDGVSVSERNLSLALLEHNGTYSCHVEHTVFMAQIEILELYVKPLNICAHSNGGCEHECSTYLRADSFNCSCRRGYQLASDSLGCEDINECLLPSEHSCSYPSQRCVNYPVGSYSCECAEGFTPTLQRCEDVDECGLGIVECMHECTNTPGGYTCSCRPGYTLLSIDNSTCIGTPLESPSFLITPVILASIFGVVLVLSVAVILLLVVAVCKRNRNPTRLKYEMFTKRLSGDFKCHQQVDNPVFRLDQGSIFTKRISPRKNAGTAYGLLREIYVPEDLPGEKRPRSSNYRPRSLEQAALSDGGLTTETDDLSDDVMLPKPLATRLSPSLIRHDSAQSIPRSKDSSPLNRPVRVLPHSNMVPVLPSIGNEFLLRSLKTRTDSTSKSERSSQPVLSSEVKLDSTFC